MVLSSFSYPRHLDFSLRTNVRPFVKLPVLASVRELCDMARWIQTLAICRKSKLTFLHDASAVGRVFLPAPH
jgi:hypothetical protein